MNGSETASIHVGLPLTLKDTFDARQKGATTFHCGGPEKITEGVLFLASDRSSFITGQVLKIDGSLVI